MDIPGLRAPAGAILSALAMIEDDSEEWPEALLETWHEGYLAQAFGNLIAAAMEAARPSPDDGSCLHEVVPVVVAALLEFGRGERSFVPSAAAVLTAAAIGNDIWEWRSLNGAPSLRELVLWREAARLMAEMADTALYQEAGAFGRLVAEAVTSAE